MSGQNLKVYRGEILHSLNDPAQVGDQQSFEYFPDGLLVVKDGLVESAGPYQKLLPDLPEQVNIEHHQDSLIMPGFVDCHIHYPQTQIVGAYGEQLIEWLNNYTFPMESEFSSPDNSRAVADIFIDELLRNGTTAALVMATVHKQSAEAFFRAASNRRMRMICGKIMMDRNAPDYLTDTAESGYEDSAELIGRWHGKDRLSYAITPRFAPTSSEDQLKKAGQLLREHPGVYMHTHLAENLEEIKWVKELFPRASGYLDVYDHYGLLGKRSIFAHCIHLNDHEFELLHKTGSGIAFCPTSNLFLGSGLFPLSKTENKKVNTGLATDIGGGTSFSLLQTINEAYKIQQLQKHRLSPFKSLYLATLGGARTLGIDKTIGNFEPGKEADFIVLDYRATPLLDLRLQRCTTIADKFFALTILGDDRAVKATYILGKEAYRKG
ncbi:MAG: guanine deaminase [Desulfobacteraceae bacterium]|nr:guanine deaminase [Desulfobacteraceae bacterium]